MGTELPCPVDLIIPYQPGGSLREANLHRLMEHWLDTYEGLAVHVGLLGSDEPWCKGRAIERAARHAQAPVRIVADADVWPDPACIADAVRRLHSGRAPWVVPHGKVYRLDAATSSSWAPGGALGPCERAPYQGVPGGGVFAVRLEDHRWVPMDPRFVGHGGQDIAWAHTADTLLGRHVRLRGPLVHLHHEVQPSKDDPEQRDANFRLMRRYAGAAGKPSQMARLVREAIVAYGRDQIDA